MVRIDFDDMGGRPAAAGLLRGFESWRFLVLGCIFDICRQTILLTQLLSPSRVFGFARCCNIPHPRNLLLAR